MQDNAPAGQVRVERRTVNGRVVNVYVYDPWWAREDRLDPVLAMLNALPPDYQATLRVERLSVASRTSESAKDVTIIYRRRVKVIARRVAKNKRGFTRRAVWNMEEPMAEGEVRKIVLHDGTVTDNQGWNRRERVGKTPHYTKTVNGKVYVIDSFAAMGARVPGSFTEPSTPANTTVIPLKRSEGTERYEARTTPRIPARRQTVTVERKTEKPKATHGMAAVLNKQAKKLMAQKGGRR